MITANAADTGNTLGTGAAIALACFVLLSGAGVFWELAQEWWHARTAAATFTDDFIPVAAEVATTDRRLPQFGDNRGDTA